MRILNIHEAKTHLSKLIEAVSNGETIVIAKAGKPAARLVPINAGTKGPRLGHLSGTFTIPADFDAPLPDDVLARFEGR